MSNDTGKVVSNKGPLIVGFLLPIVGLVIGVIQMAVGNPKGSETMIASVVFWIFWMVVFTVFLGGLASF